MYGKCIVMFPYGNVTWTSKMRPSTTETETVWGQRQRKVVNSEEIESYGGLLKWGGFSPLVPLSSPYGMGIENEMYKHCH